MGQFSGTVLQARLKSIQKQAEIQLSGHFIHSCFKLTLLKINQGRVEGNLTYAS